tara:strand:+ start:52 stop:936 length:885 start_codon:yes stop_codon:yes gene_type:complete
VCLKHLDLCSGIGGFALGLQSTGYFKTIGFCEIDSFCQKVLKKNFPGVPIYNDIKEFKPNDEGLRPDIITSGFPCQPFSVAGKRKSEKDDRNLWKETFRVIKESRPTWFIGENVGGIVKLYLDTILEDLESANYSTRCFSISAQSIGAKHKRERIWIVANSRWINRGIKHQRDQKMPRQKPTFAETEWTRNTSEIDRSDSRAETLSDSNYARLKEQWQSFTDEKKHETFKCSNWWEIESELCGVPNGISYGLDKDRSNRIKALGNAIVPQIPYYIGLAIKEVMENSNSDGWTNK